MNFSINYKACEAPASQNENSHYVCDDNGDIKCLSGWTGDLCDVPICRKGCDPQQGYCKRPGECRCKLGTLKEFFSPIKLEKNIYVQPYCMIKMNLSVSLHCIKIVIYCSGYYGELCNRCITLPGCQHGYCNNSFECICEEGWDGLFCSERLYLLIIIPNRLMQYVLLSYVFPKIHLVVFQPTVFHKWYAYIETNNVSNNSPFWEYYNCLPKYVPTERKLDFRYSMKKKNQKKKTIYSWMYSYMQVWLSCDSRLLRLARRMSVSEKQNDSDFVHFGHIHLLENNSHRFHLNCSQL